MQRLNYHEIVDKLGGIDRWLHEMGLDQYDRIRIHQRNITELAEAFDNGKLDQIAGSLTGEKRREIMWSFVESIEFVDAIEALQEWMRHTKGCVGESARGTCRRIPGN